MDQKPIGILTVVGLLVVTPRSLEHSF